MSTPVADLPSGVTGIVSAAIRVRLVYFGRRQHELADWLDITPSQLSKRLRGTVVFDVEELDRVAAFFGIPITDLFRMDPPSGTARAGAGLRACRDSNPKPSDPKVLPYGLMPVTLAA